MIGLGTPHHDGSALYVSNPNPRLGEVVTLFLRVPRSFEATGVWVRSAPDGEASLIEASVDRVADGETWWRVDLPIHNPVTNYRFVLRRGRVIEWLSQSGLQWWESTDATDFRLVTYAPPPTWAAESVFYEIFPDRFSRAGERGPLPPWALEADWDDPVAETSEDAVRQLYGGNLDGIVARLDHIESLGATGLYLTPIFPATSSHRYNASSFESVDPVLGGDEALVRLTTAAHARGMRVLCDFTSNHCGDTHDWFRAAQSDAEAPEAAFFYFKRHPHDYISWLGVKTLPKFDHRNDELRRRLYEGPESIFGRWLSQPFDIDGWRIDVANMSGRYADVNLNPWVARAMRWTMFMTKPDAFLLAENFFDATPDLLGDGWHGVMNYAGFARPVWQWLASPEEPDERPWFPVLAPTSGLISYFTMRDFMAAVPWRAAVHNFNLLDSHDTARFRSIAGDAGATKVGVGLQFTFPGIPMVFAGDEIGLDGRTADDTRKPIPWDHPDRWDGDMLEWYRTMISLRRTSAALREGGMRWVSVTDDVMVFLRESRDERVLVQASRRPHPPLLLDATELGAREAEALVGEPLVIDGTKAVLPSDGPSFNVWRVA